ncbi:MAG: HU family DNA-binding protein [Myxococcales bacterium]|nr:HU family DNA-binding protein [Myxococcales bacterium]
MRQKDLIDLFHKTHGGSKEQSAKELDRVFEVISKALAAGEEKVPMSGLGTLHLKTTKARTGRNPSTGAPIEIPSRKKVSFKASSELMTLLNGSPDDDDSDEG